MQRIIALLLLCTALPANAQGATVLGIEGSRFTLDGKPAFLLGFSYYAGLGASEEFIRSDLDDFQMHGFNWLRVWATWASFGNDVSAVDAQGRAREPFLDRLKWLVADLRYRLHSRLDAAAKQGVGWSFFTREARRRVLKTSSGLTGSSAVMGHRS